MLGEQRKKLLKHIILSQILMESADDCLNEKILRNKEKMEVKRYIASLEKTHKDNLIQMYNINSQTFINLTHIIDTVIEEIASLSLEEFVTLNSKWDEIRNTIQENTPKHIE